MIALVSFPPGRLLNQLPAARLTATALEALLCVAGRPPKNPARRDANQLISCPNCRLLNELPATRLTATALEAFLRVTGFRLYAAYRNQFVKLLHLVDQTFLAALQQVSGSFLRPQRALHFRPLVI